MIYFTSDTHFGHWALITGRKNEERTFPVLGPRAKWWSTADEMDAAILDAINSIVQKGDTLYHLGDWGLGVEAGKYRLKIMCKDVRLIWGNHDSPRLGAHFTYKWDVRMVKIGCLGTQVWLSHYPHAIWPASHHGSLHLYGHCHSQREETLDSVWPDRRSMDVGVDNAMRLLGSPRPFSEVEVMDRLLPRQGHDLKGFYDRFKEIAA